MSKFSTDTFIKMSRKNTREQSLEVKTLMFWQHSLAWNGKAKLKGDITIEDALNHLAGIEESLNPARKLLPRVANLVQDIVDNADIPLEERKQTSGGKK